MTHGFPGGSFKRRVAKYGESVTFETDDISTDEDTDWNDQTINPTTLTVDAVVQKERTSIFNRTEEGDEVEVDATVYVHDDDLGTFPLADGGAGGPTTVTTGSQEYVVLTDDVRPNGVHEIEVARV